MEEIFKISGILATVFASYKIIVDVIIARSSKHRDEYNFSKEYIVDLDDEKVHRFVKEKGFRALAGDSYSVEEIKYLLSFSEPTKAINLRYSAKLMVEFNKQTNKYCWKRTYKFDIFRKCASEIYISLYVLFAFLAIFPIYFGELGLLTEFSNLSFAISMGVIAVASLIKQMDFKEASTLMGMQQNA